MPAAGETGIQQLLRDRHRTSAFRGRMTQQRFLQGEYATDRRAGTRIDVVPEPPFGPPEKKICFMTNNAKRIQIKFNDIGEDAIT